MVDKVDSSVVNDLFPAHGQLVTNTISKTCWLSQAEIKTTMLLKNLGRKFGCKQFISYKIMPVNKQDTLSLVDSHSYEHT